MGSVRQRHVAHFHHAAEFLFRTACAVPAATHRSSDPGCRRGTYWHSGPARRWQQRGVGHCVLPRGVGCAFNLRHGCEALASRGAPSAGAGQPAERGIFPAGLVFLSPPSRMCRSPRYCSRPSRVWVPVFWQLSCSPFLRILGPTPSAGLAAAVPASATLLAIPVLAEIPNGHRVDRHRDCHRRSRSAPSRINPKPGTFPDQVVVAGSVNLPPPGAVKGRSGLQERASQTGLKPRSADRWSREPAPSSPRQAWAGKACCQGRTRHGCRLALAGSHQMEGGGVRLGKIASNKSVFREAKTLRISRLILHPRLIPSANLPAPESALKSAASVISKR